MFRRFRQITDWIGAQFQLLRSKRWAKWAVQVFIAALFTSAIGSINLDNIEAYFYDLRFRLRPDPTPSGQVEIVLMDNATVQQIGSIPQYSDYKVVLERIIAQKPKAIVIVPPLNATGDIEDDLGMLASAPEGSQEDALALAKVIAGFPQTYQLTYKFKLAGQIENYKLGPPFQFVPTVTFTKSVDGTLFAKDGVSRRAFVSYQEQPLGPLALLRILRDEEVPANDIRGQFDVYDSRQVYIDFARSEALSRTKFEDLLTGPAPEGRFSDKLVFIGDDFGKTIKNYVPTPFSRDPGAIPLVDLHAHTMETFIRNSSPLPSPDWVRGVLLFLISLFTIRVVLSEHPLRGLTHLAMLTVSLVVIAQIAFVSTGFLVPMSHPLLGIFLCYYFFIPYRLIVENRRSWEYRQKHELLKQVEELKTNFISMMSHDLKTPIARIQGMTDLITRDGTPLSPNQREGLDHIRASSEDLLKFINAILNYAKIESEGVQLHLQSRDINQVIKDVVRQHEFLARLKHITIQSDLEPLFPIRMDPELIRQVISNLVENAIKYSPENTQVTITSQEVDGFVRVTVADQGAGIAADDLPNVFMKFFRSKAAKSSPVKGSGLGLYLAKYFVELHKGQISVQSVPKQGTSFSVDLPL